ncbi:MAG: DNA mismatch repair protein, partial [Erysipelotrichaceae bacterium]
NSADRIIGAKEAIHRLQKSWILSFVTTHDFELCELDKEKDMDIVNYHFNEYYERDEIHFDYKIKEGRCLTTNALQLMKMAGIL